MYDVIIIGGGIVGCATAFYLSQFHLSVLLLEKENDVANGTTKANSAIVHAGYDPKPGTWMSKFNVRGVELTKRWCAKLQIPFSECGSLVLAFSEEEKEHLQFLLKRGLQNGVSGLSIWNKEKILSEEPHLNSRVQAALYAPSAGIISPWELALQWMENAVANGVSLLLSKPVTDIHRSVDGFYTVYSNEEIYEGKYVINAAGICSDFVHNMVAAPAFKIIPEKGEYFILDKAQGNMLRHVIFQCPTEKGKGVLVSPTVHGNLIVGPNSEKTQDEDSPETTAEGLVYVSEMSRLSVPEVPLFDTIRNFAGNRAISDRDDFIIEEAKDAPGFFDFAGIKSPGLTSAAAIGEYAVEMLREKGLELRENTRWECIPQKKLFRDLSETEKKERIRENPAYGRVICRCETITEGDIREALSMRVKPASVDGVKRRCLTGMGRCQGGFCEPRVLEILSDYQKTGPDRILKDKANSYILAGKTKEQAEGGSLCMN